MVVVGVIFINLLAVERLGNHIRLASGHGRTEAEGIAERLGGGLVSE